MEFLSISWDNILRVISNFAKEFDINSFIGAISLIIAVRTYCNTRFIERKIKESSTKSRLCDDWLFLSKLEDEYVEAIKDNIETLEKNANNIKVFMRKQVRDKYNLNNLHYYPNEIKNMNSNNKNKHQ